MPQSLSIRKVLYISEEDLQKLKAIQQALAAHPEIAPLFPSLGDAETIRTAINLTHALFVEGVQAEQITLDDSARHLLDRRRQSNTLLRAAQAQAKALKQQKQGSSEKKGRRQKT